MSSSDETARETESPLLIKSRPVPRKESSSESEGENSEPEGTAEESEEETDDDTETATAGSEKSPQLVAPVASKTPQSAPKVQAKRAPRNTVKSKTYDRMVFEAMQKLNENRRFGVSIQRVVKYVNENYDVPSDRVKLYCKKAIDKGLSENMYVHTSGVGFSGSIVFSADSWNNLKKEEKKAMKAAKTHEKSKAMPKSKAKPKPKAQSKPTTVKKTKVESGKSKNSQPQKDKNNNPKAVGKAAAKKTKKPIRLSLTLPTTKAKPKPKTVQAKTTKEKPSVKTTGKALPSTKAGKGAVTTRSKTVDA